MGFCAWCYRVETAAAICGDCLSKLRGMLSELRVLLPELETEIAKQGVKPGDGTAATEGAPAPANLTAIDCKASLRRCLKVIALRCKAPAITPDAILTIVYRAQDRYTGQGYDPLSDTLPELEELLAQARRLVDVPPEIVTVGECVCGVRLKAPITASRIKCATCGEVSTRRQARERIGVHLMDRLGGARVKISEIPLLLAQVGYTVSLGVVQGWVRRGKLTVTGGKVMFSDALDLAERRELKKE